MRFFLVFQKDIRHRRIRRNLPKMNKYFFECCERGDLGDVKRLIEERKVLHRRSEILNENGLTLWSLFHVTVNLKL